MRDNRTDRQGKNYFMNKIFITDWSKLHSVGIKQATPNKIINQTIGVRNRSLLFLFDTDDKQVATKSPINKE